MDLGREWLLCRPVQVLPEQPRQAARFTLARRHLQCFLELAAKADLQVCLHPVSRLLPHLQLLLLRVHAERLWATGKRLRAVVSRRLAKL